MKRKVISAISIIFSAYLLICIFLYFFQEKLLFFPQTLAPEYKFHFAQPFEEKYFDVGNGIALHAVLFKSPNREKVIFYLHGNGGAVDRWGLGADLFLKQGYDVLYLDYRGYGKSKGKIQHETQLVSDAQIVYDALLADYSESDITLVGTSMGSGIAVQLAAKNHLGRLILNSPYASLKQLVQEKIPIIPGLLLKYKLESKKYIHEVRCPIHVFHGKDDTLIPYSHAVQLKETTEKVDLLLIEGFGHNDLPASEAFHLKMKAILK